MEYRVPGNTSIRVSVIGLGCEGFLNKTSTEIQEVFTPAMSHGVNCMDLHSPNPEPLRAVGEHIRAVGVSSYNPIVAPETINAGIDALMFSRRRKSSGIDFSHRNTKHRYLIP